ncbi:alpha/beta hydrolase family protein [Cohnella nanjingensis]|uniref:Alpha/beta hydrolase n=1 Tax=Cohnella nanjingensis TaxID=1387779 RepID=A0A7X0RP59_9BACL|nr:alpha/beta hydrolase [Cohnella nanjingensis]MBB6669840.1 alpha/beta hydrolase [Cohnella nanjingensis]
MEMQYEPASRLAVPRRPRLGRLIVYDRGGWGAAGAGSWVASCAAAVVGMLGVPTGLGRTFDVLSAVALATAGYAISSLIVAWLLGLLRRPLPGAAIGGLLYTAILVFFILFLNDLGVPFSLLFAAGYTAFGAGAGFFARAIGSRRTGRRAKLAAAAALALMVAATAYAIVVPDREDGPAAPDGVGLPAGAAVVPDPSVPGSHAYTAFTYGSGADRQRKAFGSGAALRSESVDASAYIPSWPLLRRWFWGFDAHALPLNGRVWMPEGEGPFPLVLMVHGNHVMEDFSDEGYGYLGEQLASRGIIAISVDENFLNYSAWSGIPAQDMKVRAWLLLCHIRQLQTFAAAPDSPFYGKVDFARLALLGHSRGGQAVAMAADADRWFSEAPGLPEAGSYRIRSVVALAPTDTVVDGAQAELRDTSYLTLQGASDADVNNFYGDRQYVRTTFTGAEPGAFKASLYIADANHGQFNTGWGDEDATLPASLFLRKPNLSATAQERIAKAYVSAFFEDTLLGNAAYADLFRDYRAGRGFLPVTRYYNRYEDAGFNAIARFDEALSADRPSAAVTADAEGFERWELTEALDRQREGKGTKGTALKWSEEGGTYAIEAAPDASVLDIPGLAEADGAELVFSMADLSRDLSESEDLESAPLDLDIALEDGNGVEVTLPLDAFMQPEPLPETNYTWLAWLEEEMEEGKYAEPVEPVFQTYALPLEAFQAADPQFSPDSLRKIAFLFRGGPGKAMLADIGIGNAAREDRS